MTTENTQSEHDDARLNVAEESHASPPFNTEAMQSGEETSSPTHSQQMPVSSTQPAEEMPARPFSSFIEEFRLSEEHPKASSPTPTEESFAALLPFTTPEEGANVDAPQSPAEAGQDEQASPIITPGIPTERPVSPLLRPATRMRVSRHGGRHRQEPAVNTAQVGRESAVNKGEESTANAAADTTVQAPHESAAAVHATQETQPAEPIPGAGNQETPRPPRRYRFDRPSATSAAPVTATNAVPQTGKPAPAGYTRVEDNQNGGREGREGRETPAARGAIQPQNGTEGEALAILPAQSPAEGEISKPTDHRSRHQQGQQRQRPQKTQKTQETPAAQVASPPVMEVTVTVDSEPTPGASAAEVALEDLPPLEYSELQAATSRRRRRRRAGGPTLGIPGAPVVPASPAAASQGQAAAPTSNAPTAPAPGAPYSIQSGVTLNQMNQGSDLKGPFMGPEPSIARGSLMQPSIRPLRGGRNGTGGDGQRSITPTQPVRPGEGIISNSGINHLANVITQAIQTQTDRTVAELRRATQGPTNVSVSVPSFPSTERVGVFVDVANLLYSARNMRVTIDFGKLLDFLRGNRRLVRAHAYAPTSPQPGEDQMFLQAVKGLGYRITTKNYKTFASGARKADLDLDLCMDVVRLVDGRAVDCIVLVSGDSDFMPMLDYCSDHGVRVEIAAFDESMSATLRQSCDLFINLAMLEEIRA